MVVVASGGPQESTGATDGSTCTPTCMHIHVHTGNTLIFALDLFLVLSVYCPSFANIQVSSQQYTTSAKENDMTHLVLPGKCTQKQMYKNLKFKTRK